MKKLFSNAGFFIAVLLMGLAAPSCNNYLDVVPDNVLQYKDLFVSQKRAYNALASCYLGVPFDFRESEPNTLGDEWVMVNPVVDASRTAVKGTAIMRGMQSATNTLMSYWTGHNTTRHNLWNVIRDCNLLIEHIHLVPDMTAESKEDWKAQAKFLKAFYLYRFVECYGPVIIPKTYDPNELNSDLFEYRSKVEDCFDYIIKEIDEAIPYLKEKAGTNELGMVDQVSAKAMKARILLVRASPFFNGNSEYYSNFLDHKGEHFFSQTPDAEKWKLAADAAREALDDCEYWGFKLFRFNGRPYAFDMDDFQRNPDRMQALYDLRFRTTERWNQEIIWGVTMFATNNMGRTACIKKPDTYGGPAPANIGDGWAGASYQAMQRYYTEHGLPIEEDRTVNPTTLHDVVTTPDETASEYDHLRGYMQPGVNTINMYLNREPRFYADLGITGGYYRAHQVRISTMMFQGTDGGYNATRDGNMMNSSGIAVQKNVHPESYYVDVNSWVVPPYPVIRVADLYLIYAEAMNEYYGPSQEVYDAVDAVRLRAGLPTVQESYGDDSEWVTDEARNKHLSKEGMREIILRERTNEFAFETGSRFWDMRRWKRAVSEFSRPIYGWNYLGTNAATFFNHTIIQGRKWSVTDCLWPIDNREMDRNAKLIQNPGW